MVIIPKPPIWIKSKIMICPNVLQVDTVGNVTSPVTHTEVVAVNKASIYGTASKFAELIGKDSKRLPANIARKKLSITVWVVENLK